MTRKQCLYILFLLFTNSIFCQEVTFHELESTLNYQYEFSSLKVRNDSILLMSEGCKQLFICDLKSKKVINSIPITNPKTDVDIEGFCLFQDVIFYTDESDNSIHLEGLTEKNNQKISFQEPFNVYQSHNKDKGLEGVEINAKGDYLYVLREKNSAGNKSYIYCFNVTFKNETYHLNLDKRIEIELYGGQRYSDLTLSSDQKRIYLIRSTKGKYYIDTIVLNEQGKFDATNYKSSKLTSINLSSIISSKDAEDYSSNVEGIATYGNSIFLISDNKFGDGYCDVKGDKTMLVEIKL